MSVELLDKTRKINQLLRDNRVSKVAFTDLCRLLGELLESSVYVISNKGKILGINQMPDDTPHSFFPSSEGQYMDAKMAKRFLEVLSTKENVNLEFMGFPREVSAGSPMRSPTRGRHRLNRSLGTLRIRAPRRPCRQPQYICARRRGMLLCCRKAA